MQHTTLFHCEIYSPFIYILQITWNPYGANILHHLPPYCLNGRHIWTALVPLICIHIVEWHPTDRVMRQFGYIQRIPRDPTNIEQLHHVDLRSRHLIWSEYHAPWIQLWRDRGQYIQQGTPGSATMHYHGRYMEWYRRITRRWIGIPGASIGASVSVYIFPNTLILLKK